MKFQDKVILITGASSGIGAELAKQLSEYDCSLALLARREYLLSQLEDEIKQHNNNVVSIKCDVSNRQNVNAAIKTAINAFGKIDIAILNAGVNIKTKLFEFDAVAAEETFDVNIVGMAYFFEELIPRFKNKGGVFIGISSLADGRGFPFSGFYCASKAAATLFLESQRIELKPLNIKVITVKPGFVKTPMTDSNKFKMPFLMDVENAARIIIKGIEKEKRTIQFPWQTVLGAKLLRILPDPLFDLIAENHRRTILPKNRQII
jgi:short-subunit dehydrogenase